MMTFEEYKQSKLDAIIADYNDDPEALEEELELFAKVTEEEWFSEWNEYLYWEAEELRTYYGDLKDHADREERY